MKPSESYRAWLKRRIEDGSDLDRCRRQIEVWAAKPPEGTTAGLFTSMLAELDAGKSQTQPAPPADVDAFG